MSQALIVKTTQIGKQRAFEAQSNGLNIRITHIGVGDGAYTPSSTQTSLLREKDRLEIRSSQKHSEEYSISLNTVIDNAKQYWVSEVGCYLEDGTLFAVWSDPTVKLGYKSVVNKFLLGYTLKLVDVPFEMIEVIDHGADLQLTYAKEHRAFDTLDWQTAELTAEYIRAEKNTGILSIPQFNARLGDAFKQNLISILGHNHSNYRAMTGTGMLEVNANGYVFSTRHNDSRLFTKPAGGGYMQTVESAMPVVPTVISGTVAEQKTKMSALLNRYLSGTLANANEKAGFGWEMLYMEAYWEVVESPDAGIPDSFASFRHTYGNTTPRTMAEKALKIRATGKKVHSENVALMPFVRKVDTVEGTKYVILRYRILSHKLPHLNGKLYSEVLTQRMDDSVLLAKNNGNNAETSYSSFFKLKDMDALLSDASIAGVGGYAESITGSMTIDGHPITSPTDMARYHREYSITSDAMGERNFVNGWNDPTLVTASTNNPAIWQGTSYFLPLEMILRTPLESWNPYNLPEVTTVSGLGTQASPWNGIRGDARWYLTPAEFVTGEGELTPADTGFNPVWIKDAGGVAREVRSSGLFLTFPPCAGVSKQIRLRYPVAYFAHEYSIPGIMDSGLKQEMYLTINALMQNITALQLQARSNEEMMKAVIENMNLGFVLADNKLTM